MDVKRQTTFDRDPVQPDDVFDRDRTHAVGDHADRLQSAVQSGLDRVEATQVLIDRNGVEASLRAFEGFSDVTGLVAGDEFDHADSGVFRGDHHRVIESVVLSVIVTDVVKLPHRGHTVGDHFVERGETQFVTAIGIERLDEVVHRVAPAPEGTLHQTEALGPAAQGELKRMRVTVHEPGHHRAVHPLGVSLEFGNRSDRGDPAVIIDEQTSIALKARAVPEHGWFEQSWHGRMVPSTQETLMPKTKTKTKSKTKTKTSPSSKRQAKARRTRTMTPEDLLRVVRVGDPRLAPDGSRVLFHVRTVGEKNDQPTELWLADTEHDRVRRLTAGPRDRQGRFSPDGSAVYFVRASEASEPQIAVVALDGGEAEALTELAPGSIGSIMPSACGRWVAFTYRATDPERTPAAAEARKLSGASEPPLAIESPWYRLDGDGYFGNQRWSLRVLDLKTGDVRILDDKDQGWGYDFDFTPDGSTIAYVTNRSKRAWMKPESQQVRLVDVASGKSRKLDWFPPGPKSGLTFNRDGSMLAYGGRIGTDDAYSTNNLELFVADIKKKTTRSLSEKTDYCMQAFILSDSGEAGFDSQLEWSADGKRVYARVGWHGEGRLVSFPLGRGTPSTLFEGPHENIFGNIDAKGRQICLLHGDATTFPEVHVAALRGVTRPIEPKRLTNFNGPLLNELSLSKPKSHWVTAEDGTKVQAG